MTFIATLAKKSLPKPKKRISSDLDLSSVSKAKEWALKNINDLDGDEDEDGEIKLTEQIEQRISDYCWRYQEEMKQTSVTVYRALCLKKREDLDLKKLGPWWSFEKDGVGCYGTDHGGKIMVVLQADIAPRYIDWETGFTSFLWYGEDQWEAALEPGSPITLTHIDEKKLDKPIKTKV